MVRVRVPENHQGPANLGGNEILHPPSAEPSPYREPVYLGGRDGGFHSLGYAHSLLGRGKPNSRPFQGKPWHHLAHRVEVRLAPILGQVDPLETDHIAGWILENFQKGVVERGVLGAIPDFAGPEAAPESPWVPATGLEVCMGRGSRDNRGGIPKDAMDACHFVLGAPLRFDSVGLNAPHKGVNLPGCGREVPSAQGHYEIHT